MGPDVPRMGWQVRSITGLRGKTLKDAIERAVADPDVTKLPAIRWTEGPFRSDDGYLESKLVGCVIGIYAPAFEGPLRTVNDEDGG